MINLKYEQLSKMTYEDLFQELVHRLENFSKYKLLMDKWSSFTDCDDDKTSYAIKICENFKSIDDANEFLDRRIEEELEHDGLKSYQEHGDITEDFSEYRGEYEIKELLTA